MSLFVSPKEYFSGVVKDGLQKRRVAAFPRVETYLIDLLQYYLDAKNLFEPETDENGQRRPTTLAEQYLLAAQCDQPLMKAEKLKRLGDHTLYVSGFFGDSLSRKLVDVDYYADMGVAAYRDLAATTSDETLAKVYTVFSSRFIDYVDVLTYISQKSLIHSNESILRLYDRYLKTGSELARERLNEMGVLTVTGDKSKKTRQF